MTRVPLALAIGALASSFAAGVARADDDRGRVRVHATATVEVLDDASKVDDIIARLKTAQQPEARPKASEAQAAPAAAKATPPAPAPSSKKEQAGEAHERRIGQEHKEDARERHHERRERRR